MPALTGVEDLSECNGQATATAVNTLSNDRPEQFAGQRTKRILEEMGGDLAGMGCGVYGNEEDFMMGQPIAKEP